MISTLIMAAAMVTPASPGPVGWLAGTWLCRASVMANGPVFTEETWRPDGRGGLAGEVRGYQDTGTHRIERWRYHARITGRGRAMTLIYARDGVAPRTYRLVRSGPREAVFATRAAGRPQRIAYRGTPNGIIVNSGMLDGSEADSRTTLVRPGVAGSTPPCRSDRVN